MKRFLLILLVIGWLGASSQISLPSDPTYNAGVVEYPMGVGAARDRTTITSDGFRAIIESNQTADLDIIVFPEYVLNSRDTATFVPHPDQNVTPCISPDYEMFLVELSCAARSRGIYVVLNMVEKELCHNGLGSATLNPCPASGLRYLNTNVVLDRRGRVISRYRKTHLWRQEYYSRSVMVKPELSTFETDFGVTFGQFICFDMLFYEPAMQLLLERNVTDIVYPTYWFSELPFLTALQLQEGWAFGNDVNLLAADGSMPSGKTSGSGIFAGRAGRLEAAIYEEPTQRLIKAQVPKRHLKGNNSFDLPVQIQPVFRPQMVTPRLTQLATYRDYNVDIFSTELLEPNFTNVTQRLCHNSFCCDFSVQRQQIGIFREYAAYRYRLAAYHGNETTFIRVDRSEQAICAVFSCLSEELLSCGYIFPQSVAVANYYYFDSIKISGVFPAAPRRLIMPSTLDGMMMPLSVAQYNWTETPTAKQLEKDTRVEMELIKPKNDLLTFAIWANYFTQIPTNHNLDHLQPKVGGGSRGNSHAPSVVASSLCLVMVASTLMLKN